MLTTLSIISLEQGRIWSEASATPEPEEQPEAEWAPERRPLRRSGFRPCWRSSGRRAPERHHGAHPRAAATAWSGRALER